MKRLLLLTNLLLINFVFSQDYASIQGKIVGANNQPIPFANVYIKALKQGTMANENGLFQLNTIKTGDVELQSSAVGFKTQLTPIVLPTSGLKNIIITLQPDASLTQVEVFGRRNSHPDKIEALTRLPLEPYEQIQSISVISEKLIEMYLAFIRLLPMVINEKVCLHVVLEAFLFLKMELECIQTLEV